MLFSFQCSKHIVSPLLLSQQKETDGCCYRMVIGSSQMSAVPLLRGKLQMTENYESGINNIYAFEVQCLNVFT